MFKLTNLVRGSEIFIESQFQKCGTLNCFSQRFRIVSTPSRAVRISSCDRGQDEASAPKEASLKDISEIPGPKCYPIVKCLPYFAKHKDFNSENSYRIWESMFEKYGDLITLKLPFSPTIVGTLKPEHVEMYMKSTMNEPIRDAFKSLKSVRDSEPTNFFNKKAGLLPENGEEWWRVRTRVQAALLKPKNVAMYLPKVDKATMTFMDRIDALQKENKDGRVPDDFLEELYKWALECVALVALNKELGCLDPGIKEDSTPMLLIKYINQVFVALNITEIGSPIAWKLYRTQAYIDLETAHNAFLEIARNSINEASQNLEEAKKRGDTNLKLSILDNFLQTEGLSESDVATVIMDMLFAGVDTTSHTIAFTLYQLATNPNTQRKLQEEIDRVMGDSAEILPEHISEMKYLGYVLKESLRLNPITLVNGRVLTSDIVLSGYKIPKGTFVLSYSRKITNSERNFSKADEFIPERWARDRPHGDIHPFASLPFSHGKRMCIGKRIAEQEIYNFIIRALQRYNVTFESDEKMSFVTTLVTKPAIPLAFKFHRR